MPGGQPSLATARRVLVTGAGGMLAFDLSPRLAQAGFQVYARPRADLDVTDAAAVARAFREIRPDTVVNCAAFTKVDACESDPRAEAVNAGGPANLARECAQHGAALVQVSTDFVFDGAKEAPYTEDDEPRPLSVYGRTKREGEEAALAIPGALVVRSSWLFGRGGPNFVEAILKQADGGRPAIDVVVDQRGRPTGAPDLAEAIVALVQSGASGVYHFANQGETSWYEFARAILDLSARESVELRPIDSQTLARPAPRPAYSTLDTSLYEKRIGLPIRPWIVALAEYLAARSRPEA